MVWTSGLTRSKGRVSHAGKSSTTGGRPPGASPPAGAAEAKASRSWASWAAAARSG